MDEYLWPARNVAEYAYCPRLFYFMEVEGIHLPSADTEQGVAVHKRVDRASAAKSEDDDPHKPHVARSLTLTSKSLGLTAPKNPRSSKRIWPSPHPLIVSPTRQRCGNS